MYKFFFLFLLFVAVESYGCHRDGPCAHKDNARRQARYNTRYFDTVFEDVSSSVIEMDRKYQAFCSNSSEQQIREYYGDDIYTLKYALTDYSVDDITIKMQHRVMYLKAQKSYASVFMDIRILPTVVDTKTGEYYKDKDDLFIQFSYKTDMKTENVVTCSDDVSDGVQKLPKVTPQANEVSEDELRMAIA